MDKNTKIAKSKSSTFICVLSVSLIVLIALLAEFALSNITHIKLKAGNYEEINLSASDISDNDESELIFDEINKPVQTVSILFDNFGKREKRSEVELHIKDKNSAYRFVKAAKYSFLPEKGNYSSFNINPVGELKELKIILKDDSLSIKSVVLNKDFGISFNFFRFILISLSILAIYFIIKHKIWLTVYTASNKYHCIAVVVAVILCMIFSVLVSSYTLPHDAKRTYDYPLKGSNEDIKKDYGLYTLQFDAFLKGQLNLDVEFDSEALEALENPYDNSERKEIAGGNVAIWDSAYYNGKIYSYFGVSPIIFIYYPYYLVSGSIPTENTVCEILSIFSVLFLSLAFLEVQRRFCKSPPILLTIIGIISLNFASLIYFCQAITTMYNIACLSAMLFLSMFIYTSFRAVRTKEHLLRNVFFVLSGISAVSVLASRPIVVVYCLIILPIYFGFLFDMSFTKTEKIKALISFFTPIAVLGSLLMWYNYARFESPFQFGAIYNITVNDTSTNTMRLFLLFPAIYHVFLQPSYIDTTFPFIHTNLVNFNSYRGYFYVQSTIGVLAYPITWGLFTAASTIKGKSNKIKRYTFLILIATLLGVAFIDTCMAGVHSRYSTDFILICALFGLIFLLDFIGELKNTSVDLYKLTIVLACIFCIISLLTGVARIFDNENNLILSNHPDTYRMFESIFR